MTLSRSDRVGRVEALEARTPKPDPHEVMLWLTEGELRELRDMLRAGAATATDRTRELLDLAQRRRAAGITPAEVYLVGRHQRRTARRGFRHQPPPPLPADRLHLFRSIT